MKTALHTQAEFQARIGKVLFESSPLIVTRDQIQDYCRSLNQLDWFHFDEARGKSEGFGGIIAPGSLTFALVHSTFFQCVELVDLKALFIGSDRFRVHRPINAGDSITLTMGITTVEDRPEGFRVQYGFRWHGETNEDTISEGTFLVRYWLLSE